MRQVLKHRNLTVNTTQNRERPQLSRRRVLHIQTCYALHTIHRVLTHRDQNTMCWLPVRAHFICAAHILTSTRKRSGWMV